MHLELIKEVRVGVDRVIPTISQPVRKLVKHVSNFSLFVISQEFWRISSAPGVYKQCEFGFVNTTYLESLLLQKVVNARRKHPTNHQYLYAEVFVELRNILLDRLRSSERPPLTTPHIKRWDTGPLKWSVHNFSLQ